MRWVLPVVMLGVMPGVSGCALHLTRGDEKADLEKACQSVTLSALNERDEALKQESRRQFEALERRLDQVDRDAKNVDRHIDEVLAMERARYQWRRQQVPPGE